MIEALGWCAIALIACEFLGLPKLTKRTAGVRVRCPRCQYVFFIPLEMHEGARQEDYDLLDLAIGRLACPRAPFCPAPAGMLFHSYTLYERW